MILSPDDSDLFLSSLVAIPSLMQHAPRLAPANLLEPRDLAGGNSRHIL